MNEIKINIPTVAIIPETHKAIRALRTHGFNEEEANLVISNEALVSIKDYDIHPDYSIAPILVKAFGKQHLKDAIEYAYYYMDEYDINVETYLVCLNCLLEVYRAEELATNPEKIRALLTKLFLNEKFEEIAGFDDMDEEEKYGISENIITTLVSELSPEDIRTICQ